LRKAIPAWAKPTEKIVIFADEGSRAGEATCGFLDAHNISFVFLEESESMESRNEKISWFRNIDVTEEEKARPRVLLLQFDHAAGLNLQISSNVILMTPRYAGSGGNTGNDVEDASSEIQAVGRVYRNGQLNNVTVHRIRIMAPEGEPGERATLDFTLTERVTDENAVKQATNA